MLAERLAKVDDGGLVVCPLAVGGHIDHGVVRAAAIAALPSQRLAFYEDLPYTAEDPAQVPAQVAGISIALGQSIKPIRVSLPNDGRRKRRLLAAYASQLSMEERLAAARYSRRGETVWATSSWKEMHAQLF